MPRPEEISREEVRYHGDLTAWNEEQARIRLGIQLLKVSQEAYRKNATCREGIPYRAWLATNASFLKAAKMDNPSWRLFQLAFVLAHIPTIASRMPEFEGYFREDYDEDKATLLYMSTGGGKSEAFFGILIFTLFFDRLRGKHRGISAMIHYPLRLLTLQQAQRLMRLLARAEIIRRKMKAEGAPFEIEFRVGSSNTPIRAHFWASDFLSNVRERGGAPRRRTRACQRSPRDRIVATVLASVVTDLCQTGFSTTVGSCCHRPHPGMVQEGENGASDGARTRDLRRDRPAL
ncbi:hypothetical protein MTBUT4_780001 [Magnetospirillum sp. UT-4]|nr:hypothetical protein MTBUT4_780001 [Magnetospirillum sp. UT-4]